MLIYRAWDLLFDIKPSVTKSWRLKNSIELSTSWQLKNHLLGLLYKAWNIKNSITIETIKAFQLLNTIEENSIVLKSWKLRNSIAVTVQVATQDTSQDPPDIPTRYNVTYQILVDNVDITNFVLDADIKLSEDNYVNTVDIKFSDLTLYNNFKPIPKDTTERISIFINGIEYAFLLEERTSEVSFNQLGFSVWGRSKSAILDKPFSEVSIIEFSDSGQASDIIDSFANGIPVTFEIVDFFIKEKTLHTNGKSPLQIIKMIADAGGGIVRSGKKNELIVRYRYPDIKNINLLTPDESLNDLMDVTVLDESEIISNGLNAVLVEGKITRVSRLHGRFEIDPLRNPNGKVGKQGSPFYLKLYLFPISRIDSDVNYPTSIYTMELSDGDYLYAGSLAETITDEVIQIINGQATTSYPVKSLTSVTWLAADIGDISLSNAGDNYLDLIPNSDKSLGIAKITYETEYDLYYITNTNVAAALVASIRENAS